MKSLFPEIDKIGLMIFVLISYDWIYEFSHIDFSIEQISYWSFYLYPFCGLLLIFRSGWLKSVGLSVSVIILVQIYFEFRGLFHNFVHHWYSKTIGFSDITPWTLLTTVAIYSVYSITVVLFTESKRNINLK